MVKYKITLMIERNCVQFRFVGLLYMARYEISVTFIDVKIYVICYTYIIELYRPGYLPFILYTPQVATENNFAPVQDQGNRQIG